MRNEKKDLGAQSATEDVTAFANPEPPQLSHAATKGPWVARVDLFRPPKLFVHAPDSYAVCRVMTAHYHAEVAKANAHLIAAAPDYWEAAEQMSTDCGELEGDDAGYVAVTKESYDALMAAHKKAEGSR